MADVNQLLTALRNADAAGDTDAAKRFASLIKQAMTPETTVGGEVKEFFKGIIPGAVGLGETAITGASALLPEEAEKAVRGTTKEVAESLKKPFAAAPGYEETIGRKLGQAIGSTIPFFAAAPFGVPGLVAGAATGVAAGAGEARERAEAAGATGSDRAMATALGIGPGLLDVVAPELRIGRTIITRALTAGGLEGATEAAQQVAQNLIAKGIYDPKQEIFVGAGEEGAYGAGAGALASMLVDSVVGRRAKGAKPAEPGKPAEEITVPPPAAPVAPTAMSYEDRAKEIAMLRLQDQTDDIKKRIDELTDANLGELTRQIRGPVASEEAKDLKEQIEKQTQIQGEFRDMAGLPTAPVPGTEFAGPLPPEPEFPTTLTPAVLSRTGLKPQSGFYKELLNKDLTNEADQVAVRNVLGKVRQNPNLSESTKQGVESVAMQAFGALSTQAEMFTAKGKVQPEVVLSQATTMDQDVLDVLKVKGKKAEEQLLGKDITNPQDAAVVKTTLEDYANQPKRSEESINAIEVFLNRPEFAAGEEVTDVGEPAKTREVIPGAVKPSVRPSDERRAATAKPRAPVKRGLVAPSEDVGLPAAGKTDEQLTLAAEKTAERNLGEYYAQTGSVQGALDYLAGDIYTGEKPKSAKAAFQSLTDEQAQYVANKVKELKAQERSANKFLDRMNREQVAARTTKYRQATEGAKGNPKDVVDRLVGRITEGWVNAPQIETVQSINELPDYIQADITKDQVNPQGAFDPRTGKVFIVADNINNSNDVILTVAHEAVGHYGLRAILGKNYAKVMDNIYNSNSEIRSRADAKIAGTNLNKQVAVEEALAEMSETDARLSPKEARQVKGVIERIKNFIRQFLVRTGYAGKISNADVDGLLDQARDYVIEGRGKQAPGKAEVEAGVFRAKERVLTPEGERAQAVVDSMAGISNEKSKQPQMSTMEKARAFFLDPTLRNNMVDKLRVQVAYKGASIERKLQDLYNGAIRDSLGDIRPDVFMTSAEHSDTLAVAVMKAGKLRLDNNIGWVAEQGKASLTGVVDKIKELGVKLGNQDLAFKLANDAFIARRANTLKNKEIVDASLLPSQDKIDAGLKAFKEFPELEAAFQEFTDFKNGLIDAMVEGGRLSKEDAQSWKDAADYVPWNRIKDYEESIQNSPQAYFKGLTNLKSMKKIKGGVEDEINNIFDNMVGLSFWMTNSAIRNHAALKLTDVFVENDLGARPVRPGQPGVDPNKTIYIYRDGKPEAYEFDSMADVYAFKGVESIGGPLLKSFTSFSNFLRKTTTATPQFAVSQLFQDSYRAMVMSGVRSPFKVASQVLTGYIDAYRGDATTQQLESMGIVGMYDLMPGRAREEIEKEFGIKQRSTFNKALNFMESFSVASDAALRKAVFERTLEETKSEQFPEGDVLLARYRAQEVINFKRQGANRTVGVLRQMIPFMNAYIQGMDVYYRSMTGRGISATERTVAAKLFWKTGAKLAALSLLYAMLVGDDDEYKGLRDYDKDKHFVVPGTGLKIPVAPEVGLLFKVIPERVYNYISSQGTATPQDATALRKALGTAAFDALTGPNLTPQAIKPTLEVMVNKSFFTGAPIVGRGLEKLEPSQQFTQTTSELAKFLGGIGNVSPMKIDYLLRGYTGIAGGTLLDVTNMAFTDTPNRNLYQLPGFKTFMYDQIPGGYKEQYYDFRERVDQVAMTINALKAQGRAEELKDYLTDDRLQLLAFRKTMNKIDQRLERLRAYRKIVVADPSLSGEAKQTALNQIEQTENDLLQSYNIPAMRKAAGL